MRGALVVAALAAVAGCYSPSIANGQLRCDSNGGVCPQGFECQEGLCWRPGTFVGADMAVPITDDMGPNDLAGACSEGTTACADATTPALCTGGVFVNQTACSGATPVCANGACVACANGDSKYVDATTIAVCTNNAFGNMSCPSTARAASVVTGKCYDPEWAAWPMPGSGTNTPSYTSGTNTVVDNVTKLVWQRGTSPSMLSWAAALNYCSSLGTLDGMTGWRLPSRIELVSLLEVLLANTPYIDTAAFPGTPSAGFWSSSLDPAIGANAWMIGFDSGDVASFAQTQTENVRCVR